MTEFVLCFVLLLLLLADKHLNVVGERDWIELWGVAAADAVTIFHKENTLEKRAHTLYFFLFVFTCFASNFLFYVIFL